MRCSHSQTRQTSQHPHSEVEHQELDRWRWEREMGEGSGERTVNLSSGQNTYIDLILTEFKLAPLISDGLLGHHMYFPVHTDT